MDHMAELFQPHKFIDLDCLGLADPIDIVSGEVNQHNMLCPVLGRCEQLGTKRSVLYKPVSVRTRPPKLPMCTFGSLPPPDGPGNRVVVHLFALDSTQGLGTCANDLQVATVDIKHVGARVDLPELSINIERVEIRLASQSLRRNSLDNIACNDMLLQLRHKALVPSLADVGHGRITPLDRRLRNDWGMIRKDDLGSASGLLHSRLIDKRKVRAGL
jgi:hypothetical protein